MSNTTLDAPVDPDRAATENEAILRLDDLRIRNQATGAEIVHGVSLTLRRGEVIGIVGESGSGKTLTCRAVLGILPRLFEVAGGRVELLGRDTASLTAKDWLGLRGTGVTAVFQDPGSYFNPSIRVGAQIAEVIRVKRKTGRREAKQRAIQLLADVRLDDPSLVYTQYPHELSGGMLQRVLIASAIALGPQILIADEVTTALDVTIQAEILDLLIELKKRDGLALIVVSHDLAVVAQLCDEVLVLKNGEVVEQGPTDEILRRPTHPYTQLLIGEHRQYGLERFRSESEGRFTDAGALDAGALDAELVALRVEESDRVG